MSGFGRKFTAAAVAISLCAVPSAAIATTQPASVATTTAAAVPVSPWLTLSALSGNASAATAAAAAQGDEGPGFPPIAPLVVILLTIAGAIYILAHNDHGHVRVNLPEPVSPS